MPKNTDSNGGNGIYDTPLKTRSKTLSSFEKKLAKVDHKTLQSGENYAELAGRPVLF